MSERLVCLPGGDEEALRRMLEEAQAETDGRRKGMVILIDDEGGEYNPWFETSGMTQQDVVFMLEWCKAFILAQAGALDEADE